MLPVRRQKTGEAMIQEGFAEKLNISYSVPEGIKESKVLLYRYLDKAVYVKQKSDDAPVLPDLEEVVKAIAEEAELVTGGSLSDGSSGPEPIYMFSIGETAFYTLAEEYLTAYTSLVAMNLATVELRFFRRSENRIYNFAASTGWQIYKWYIENRFCGRCGCNMLPGKTERSMVCSKCGMTVYPKIMPAVIVGVTNYRIPLMDMVEFIHSKVEEGYVELDENITSKLDTAYTKINYARLQLEGQTYDRMLLTLNVPEESEETYAFIADVREIAAKYYPKEDQVVYLAGLSTNALDLKKSFARDNVVVNILTALFVLVILLFTFKSAGLPLLQILVIEGAIFINFSLPAILHENLFFLSYLIVSSIQMGANIDYAIVISSRFIEERKTKGPKESIIEALLCLGRGTLISIALVLFVLPQILLFGDKLIEITTFDIYRPIKLRKAEGSIYINGTVKGSINGTITGFVKGTVKGDVGVTLINGSMENIPPELMEDVEKAVEESKEVREKEEAEKNAPPLSLKDKLKSKLKEVTKDKQSGKEEGGEKNEND